VDNKQQQLYKVLARNVAPYLDSSATQSSADYPRWWDKTVTLFMKYVDPDTNEVAWTRKVINNCFFKETKTRKASGNTFVETTQSILRIPENSLYRDPSTWYAMPEVERQAYFTLKNGDVVVAAEVTDIPDEYTTGNRMSDCLEKYKKLYPCFEIDVISINIGIGRAQPHYYVGGN